MTNAHLEKLYAKMLKENTEQVEPNRTNCYTCTNCDHITKTIDIDNGITSFLYVCEACGKEAQSTFYSKMAEHLEPTQEWYRPTLEQCKTMLRKRKLSMLNHVLNGGLDVRKINIKSKTNEKS